MIASVLRDLPREAGRVETFPVFLPRGANGSNSLNTAAYVGAL
jgi:hypothetical protein